MPVLSDEQVTKEIQSLKDWVRFGKEIKKTYQRKDFVDAMSFVNAVALLAQRADHHPDMDIRWNRVTLTLATHSEGGITEKDIALARQIERL